MGDTDRVPYDMGTFGSQTTPRMAPQLRKAAAAAREVLIDLAAEVLKTDRRELNVAEGKVWRKGSFVSLDFGQLTRGRKLAGTVGENPVTPASEWQIGGKSSPKVGGRAFVTGGHRYTSDLKIAGMLYGKVLRPPAPGDTLASVDVEPARALSGVVPVQDGDFVGVTAPDPDTAARALGALRAEWRPGPRPSARGLFEHLKANTVEAPSRRRSRHDAGSMEEGLAAADLKLERT
jgi:isoquinoline 1-oxidoreductase